MIRRTDAAIADGAEEVKHLGHQEPTRDCCEHGVPEPLRVVRFEHERCDPCAQEKDDDQVSQKLSNKLSDCQDPPEGWVKWHAAEREAWQRAGRGEGRKIRSPERTSRIPGFWGQKI